MNKSQSAGQLGFLGTRRTSFSREFGSSVAVHKLQQTKWFNANEARVLCNVVESGFITEVQDPATDVTFFGVALWKKGQEKSQDPSYLYIHTLTNNLRGLKKLTLVEIWASDCVIRINNLGCKDDKVHSEKDIRSQVKHAKNNKLLIWHNSQHFAYWCRHGDRPKDIRKRQMSECISFGTVGTNVGFMLMNRYRHRSATK